MTRILTALSVLLLWYFGTGLVANAVQLANAADLLHTGLGQYVFWVLMSVFVLLLITPIILYFKLPKALILLSIGWSGFMARKRSAGCMRNCRPETGRRGQYGFG